MQTINPDQLEHITGGRARANPDKLDSKLELALTQLKSDIKSLAQPQQPNNQLTTLMMVAMMARR